MSVGMTNFLNCLGTLLKVVGGRQAFLVEKQMVAVGH